MKYIPATVFLVVTYFTVLTQGNLFRQRRHDSEIKNRKGETIHGKAGIPLVFDKDNNAIIRTGIPELRKPEDVDTTGDSTLRDTPEDEEMGPAVIDDDEDSESGVSEKEDLDDGDDDDDDDEEKDKKSPEESGEGYEKIGNMGSKNKDDEEDEERESKGSKGTDSGDGDIMSEALDSNKKPDLNAEFPPTADQVKLLPEDDEITPEQADRKQADKRKGYAQFTIRQRFQPELNYKESAAYKILAGNVAQDVERALKATGVVRDVLFREAKNVGGPPYRSKVQVFLKLKNVSDDKVKKLVDYGLINGMITVPGSFSAK